MPVAIDIQLTGVTAEGYAEMFGRIGGRLTAAPGFLAHAAGPAAQGFHVVELWRSEEDWARFTEEVVAPLARAARIVPVTRVERLERLLTPAGAGAPGQRTTSAAAKKMPRPLARDEGEAFRLVPLTIVEKEDGSNTRQTVAVAEFGGKGFRIPPHVHTEHDETIYVVEGTLGVRLGDRTFDAPAGTLFTIPIDVVHSVWNETDVPVRFLNTIVPARYLDYFHEMALVAKDGRLAPPDEMRRVMARYGLQPTA